MTKLQSKYLLYAIALTFASSASAQTLNPGNEANMRGGGESHGTIQGAAGSGSFVLTTTNIVPITLAAGPKTVALGPDASGKGTAYRADMPVVGKELCWSGVGSDWTIRFCNTIANDGSAAVTIKIPANLRNQTFVITDRIVDGGRAVAWAPHPVEFRKQFTCPGLGAGQSDMATALHVDGNGQVRAATPAEAQAYQPTYDKACQMNRDFNNFNPA